MGEISRQRLRDLADELGVESGIHSFGVDTVSYDWVKTYVKDEETREEIKGLEGKIIEIQKLPIDKEELRAAFQENMAQFGRMRLNFLREHVKQAQQQDVPLLSPADVWAIFKGPARMQTFLNYDLTDEEINSIFLELEQGTTRAEKDKQIAAVRQEIVKLEKKIEKEFSPKERWFYNSSGDRLSYPKGCRWTAFVKVWREVAARYSEPVDVNGGLLETADERAAYGLLKLGEVFKITPLRKGMKR